MVSRRKVSRIPSIGFRAGIEGLERRDCPAAVSIATAGPADVDENGAGITLTATLSEAQSRPVEVRYFTAGTATGGRDYRLAIGNSGLATPSGSFTFRPGQKSLSIRLVPVNDVAREGTETFQFNLLSARGHTLGAKSVAGSIRDDDSFTASIVGPRPGESSARVIAGEEQTYTLQLSSAVTKTETFYVSTAAGSASSLPTADDPSPDYFPLTNLPLVFRPGETTKSFRVQTVASAANEPDQFFLLKTTAASRDIAPIQTFGVTIEGNARTPVPTVTVADVEENEGGAGKTPFVFTLSLSAPTGSPVTITYATRDGTATIGDSDYETKSGTVTIAPGETSTTVSVDVIGDTKQEPDETFSLMLTGATNATIAKAGGVATVWNDESAFQITLLFIDSSFGSVPAAVQQLAREAANRWAQVIVGDLPDVRFQGRTIDDLELAIQMGLLGDDDGTDPLTLANAAPTDYRQTGTPLPYRAITGLDPADFTGSLTGPIRNYAIDILTHEMGHALGFGAGYEPFDPFVVGNTFTGPNAVYWYQQVFSTTVTSVPLQAGVRGHWDESVFGSELMTPEAEAIGTRLYISRVTIGALQDMGYTVNYGAVEPFVPQAGVRGWAALTANGMGTSRQRAFRLLRMT